MKQIILITTIFLMSCSTCPPPKPPEPPRTEDGPICVQRQTEVGNFLSKELEPYKLKIKKQGYWTVPQATVYLGLLNQLRKKAIQVSLEEQCTKKTREQALNLATLVAGEMMMLNNMMQAQKRKQRRSNQRLSL